jgi:diguanylate cyclase (GGDEF)-like protein
MKQFSWGRARRPEETVEATRWVFALLVLVTLLVALPGVLALARGTTLLVGLVSAVVLALSWTGGYLQRSAPWWMDAVDAVAFLGFALAGPEPIAILGLIMPALWFRSLYSSTRRALLRAGIFVGPVVAGLHLWPSIPGHAGGGLQAGLLLGVIPSMFLTVIASRQLAGGLQAGEQAAQRDAVHMSVGSELLGVTDAAEIRRIAWRATAGICAATPGLRVLKVLTDGAVLRVEGATGGFAGVPASLPVEVVSLGDAEWGTGGGTEGKTAFTHPELDAAVGVPCVWACMSMPSEHTQHGSAWMLLGSPRKLSRDAIVAISTLGNQVTLALHNGEVHERLTLLAELDSLTGLANRASFNTALSAALVDTSSAETTILFVDLDDFKDVNDVHGHGAGDELLREVAVRLRHTTRPGDLCARLGGDEFAVLLTDTQAAPATEVAERIVAAFRDDVPLVAGVARVGAGLGVRIGASIGVATAGGDTGFEELIHRADVAMYAAKARGKGRIQIFERGLLRIDSAQMLFDQQLAAAAHADELVVHYQPVLSLPDGRCTAVEALVRWQHPSQGLLYPGSFIEAAERTGAIRDIGAFVLRRACADAAAWHNAYPGSALAVHVNVSALQLDDAGFIDSVSQCLEEFQLPHGQLVLEITESIVISSPMAIERLNILAALGVIIAIDDFGTGYSALTTLRSLPAQIVKIDKSFVAGCTENPQDRAVIEAVVKMAAQMGMRTIAEGVERPEQQKYLEGIRTDAVQGFLYLRPAAAQEFGSWLGAHLAGRSQTRQPGDVVIPFSPRTQQRSPSPASDLQVHGT